MTRERLGGAVLYGTAVLLLAAGALWWFRAAPAPTADPRLVAGWESVERGLPDRDGQAGARTFVMGDGSDTEETLDVDMGVFQLYLLCSGKGWLRTRMGLFAEQPGRLVPCTDPPTLVTVTTSRTDRLHATLSAAVEGRAVVRWQAMRLGDY
jgi:hypothetical protein